MKSKNRIKTISFLTGLFLLLYIASYLLIPYNNMGDSLYKKANGILKEPKKHHRLCGDRGQRMQCQHFPHGNME